MYRFYLIFTIVLLFTIPLAASEKVYVVLFMHNEDSILGDLDNPATRQKYMRHRNGLIEFAEMLKSHNTPFCWQSDWKILQAILKYDTPAVKDSTDGKNLVQYLSENCSITIDPHSHENYGYNYADVAHLIDSLGVTPTDVIGGHIWDPYSEKYANWERFREPLRGEKYPQAEWRGRILIGSGTPNHTNDPAPSGVWRPKDKYNFWTDDPQSDIVCIGQYTKNMQGLEDLIQLKQSGAIAKDEILTCTFFTSQSMTPNFTSDYEQNTLLPLLELQDKGHIEIVSYTELVHIWESEYNSAAHIYNAPQDSVPDEFSVRISSDAGGQEGIYMLVRRPAAPRYGVKAPVVVHVAGGWSGGSDFDKDFGLHERGFIEIVFNFPASGIPAQRSGGVYDDRGPYCVQALKDVMQFAMGKQQDTFGYKLHEMLGAITPLYANAGMCGWSNGGNATITTAGAWGDSLQGLAWIVNWESPVGDGMPLVDAGVRNRLNPAYNPDTGEFDYSLLAYSETLTVEPGYTGGLYFDINQNGTFEAAQDFKLSAYLYRNELYYSVHIRQAAEQRGISCSEDTAPLKKTETFWLQRNGVNWIEKAVDANPELMFLVEAGDRDHVQGALDHPHILAQYEGFRKAGASFVRLNPDRSYVQDLIGTPLSYLPDNDALAEFDHLSIRTALMPRADVPMLKGASAAMCECADRTFYNNLQPNLNNTLTLVTSTPVPDEQFQLSQNYPNPFNPQTSIEFSLPADGKVVLSVFDILGRRVAELVNSHLAAGSYSVTWNASNMPAGVYLYQLRTSSYSSARKMTLVK